ncbi:MAG: M1 family aminopeptidase [Parabacteroides sp.]|nr:M1 family aminopeptidase [Parabacteroides sp.]
MTACCSHTPEQALLQAGVSRELADFRKTHFEQVRYNLFFSIPEVRQEAVTGHVTLAFRMKEQHPIIIDFRGEAKQITSVCLNEKEVAYAVRDEHIVIEETAVYEGENRVEISFVANDQSLNRRDEFLYTLLVPDRARTLFPCFDQPDIKALFTLSLEVPDTWVAVANGAATQIDSTTTPGRKFVSFRETEPLSTYLFSFVAGELKQEKFTRDERTISVYHRETDPKKVAQCPDIAKEVFDALKWQEDYTQIPYPFAKYDVIILPGFQYGGMEHTGATLYTDGRMFLNEQPTLNERLSRSSLIAHETSHMWFGDFVTMKWFNDVWTKEVFANYYAAQMVEPQFPEVNHTLNFMLDYVVGAYAEDRTAGANPIKQSLGNMRDAGLMYGNIIYDKSPVVMSMLIRLMGEEAFQKGIQEYLKTYAYDNATWEELIAILDNYTEEDLEQWSHVWVHEKGMPEICAEIKGDSLIVIQSDPFGRGLCWPQKIKYLIQSETTSDVIEISCAANSNYIGTNLKTCRQEKKILIPNVDGAAYGFFRVRDEQEAAEWFSVLKASNDEIIRGSLLISLYENLLNQTISPEQYMDAMLDYLPHETNTLLFSAALDYIGNCQHLFAYNPQKVEEALWDRVQNARQSQHRLLAFRQYASLAQTAEALKRLYRIWDEQQAPAGCSLSEKDYTQLSYKLAIQLPEKADAIVAAQQTRITNPDRKRQYVFIAPAVSPRKEDRDSLFAALMIAENRRVEPWAATALSYLNSPFRQQEAIAYIRPALEKLEEIQRTGDIFFPRNWLRALLSGHTSAEAKQVVDQFRKEHPDYPVLLMNKMNQQADHLYRLHGDMEKMR